MGNARESFRLMNKCAIHIGADSVVEKYKLVRVSMSQSALRSGEIINNEGLFRGVIIAS